jgi:hypothetical protein
MKIIFVDVLGREYGKEQSSFPSKDLYNVLKCLEIDEDFVKKIKEIRKKLGIPEKGMLEREIKEMNDVKITNLMEKVENLLLKEFKGEKYNLIFPYLTAVVLTNTVAEAAIGMGNGEIEWWPHIYRNKKEGKTPKVTINILANISKQKFIDFIEKIWDTQIKYDVELLPKFNKSYISKRDRKIIFLKDKKKLTFPEIVKKIGNFSTETGIKKAYYRAKIKLQSEISL